MDTTLPSVKIVKFEELSTTYLAADNPDAYAVVIDAMPPLLLVSDGVIWRRVGGKGSLPEAATLSFMVKGTVAGIGINAPIDDYESTTRGLNADRIASLKDAGFNTFRSWIELGPDILLAEPEFKERLALWVAHWKKSVGHGFRVLVAQGGSYADQGAICNEEAMQKLYMERLTAIVQAMKDNFSAEDICLEMINEPLQVEDAPGLYTSFFPKCFQTARAAWKELTLVFQPSGGYAANQMFNLNLDHYDDNTMFSFHPYAPGEFTHQGIKENRWLSHIPYPLWYFDNEGQRVDRYAGGKEAMIAATTAKINASSLSASEKKQQIANNTQFIESGAYTYWEKWEDWSDWLDEYLRTTGINPRRLIAGEFGIVSQWNYEDYGPSIEDEATRDNWIRHIADQIREYGLAGGILHQCFGDFNCFEQTSLDCSTDKVLAGLAKAFLTTEPLPKGPIITYDPFEDVSTPQPGGVEDILAGNGKVTVHGLYSVSDMSTVFQDAAGKIPVTEDGQPVGLLKDTSGNGRHLVMAEAKRQPTFRKSGDVCWLDFVPGRWLHAADVSAGDFIAGGVAFGKPSDWRLLGCLHSSLTALQIAQMSSDRFIRTTSESEKMWAATHADVTINNAVNASKEGKFEEDEPFVFTARRNASKEPDILRLGSRDFTGKVFDFLITTGVPTDDERIRLTELFQSRQQNRTGYTYERGYNLAGLEFNAKALPGRPGWDYFPPKEADIAYFAKKGATIIRLPFRWERLQPELMGEFEPQYFEFIDKAVALCGQYGMRVLLDCHNYGAFFVNGIPYKVGSPVVPVSTLANLWERLAELYKLNPAVLGYDIMNEPHQMPVAMGPHTYYPFHTINQLISNGDFEVDTKDWQVRGHVKRQTNDFASGVACLGISVISTVTHERFYYNRGEEGGIPVKADTRYTFSFKYKKGVTNGGTVTWDAALGAHLGQPGAVAVQQEIELADVDVWCRTSVTFDSGEQDTLFCPAWNLKGMTGKFFIDEVNLTDTEEPVEFISHWSSGKVSTTTRMMQASIDAIRRTGSTQWVCIEGDRASGMQAFTGNYGLHPLKWWYDPLNLVFLSFHYYQDENHSGTYDKAWTQTCRDRIQTEYVAALKWARNNHVPVFMGEFGVPPANRHNPNGEWMEDLAALMLILDEYEVWGTYWASGHFYNAPTTVQPTDNYGTDRPQMAVLCKHLSG